MEENSKYSVVYKWSDPELSTLAKYIRTKYNIPGKTDIHTVVEHEFKCIIDRDAENKIYTFNFNTENEKTFFLLYT